MDIRIAQLQDIPHIAENNVQLAIESENKQIDLELTIKGVTNLLLNPYKGFYIVVEEDNKIIGQTMITYEWSDWRNFNIWWVQSVYIVKKYRHKGIFKKLFDEIKAMAKEQDIGAIKLYVHNLNKNAIMVYSHLGMSQEPFQIFELSIGQK